MNPFDFIEVYVLTSVQRLYDAWGWFGVVALVTFEAATGITPSEVILALAGWMLIQAHQLPASMIFVGGLYAALGSTLGACLTYWAVRLGGRPLLERIARWMRVDFHRLTYIEAQFHQWGISLVLIGRLIPGVRTFINIPAGLARVPFAQFFVFTLIGSYGWCTLFLGLGYLLGVEWPLISDYFKQYFPSLLLVGLLMALIYVLVFRRLLRQASLRARPKAEEQGRS